MAEQLPAFASSLQREPAYRDQPLINQMVKVMDQRCTLTLKVLSTAS